MVSKYKLIPLYQLLPFISDSYVCAILSNETRDIQIDTTYVFKIRVPKLQFK